MANFRHPEGLGYTIDEEKRGELHSIITIRYEDGSAMVIDATPEHTEIKLKGVGLILVEDDDGTQHFQLIRKPK